MINPRNHPCAVSIHKSTQSSEAYGDIPVLVESTWEAILNAHVEKEHKGDMQLFSSAIFKSERGRGKGITKDNTLTMGDAIVLESDGRADGTPLTPEDVDVLHNALDCARIFYTTFSHTIEKQKWRMIFLTSRYMTPDEYECVAKNIHDKYFEGLVDKSCLSCTRIFFLPSCPSAQMHLAEIKYSEGELLNVNAYLDTPAVGVEKSSKPSVSDITVIDVGDREKYVRGIWEGVRSEFESAEVGGRHGLLIKVATGLFKYVNGGVLAEDEVLAFLAAQVQELNDRTPDHVLTEDEVAKAISWSQTITTGQATRLELVPNMFQKSSNGDPDWLDKLDIEGKGILKKAIVAVKKHDVPREQALDVLGPWVMRCKHSFKDDEILEMFDKTEVTKVDVSDIESKSEVSVAKKLIQDLSVIGPLVSVDNKMYIYAGNSIWEDIEDVELQKKVQTYDGVFTKSGPLVMSYNFTRGAVKCAKESKNDSTFFDKSVDGLAFTNGFAIVNSNGIALKEHNDKYRVRVGLDYAYDPNAQAPMFLELLNDCFRDDTDRAEKIQFLLSFTGLCLIGKATQLQKCLLLTGRGANGKGVIMDILPKLFPIDSTTSISPQKWEEDYYKIKLKGSLINVVSELPTKDIVAGDSFKAVIGGDEITAREIRESTCIFRPKAGHVFAANELPGTNDQSYGFWRRLELITFNNPPVEDVIFRDDFLETLLQERSGIVSLALNAAVNVLRAKKYPNVPSSVKAKNDWASDTNAAKGWVEEEMEIVKKGDRESKPMVLKEGYSRFCTFANENGFMKLKKATFSHRMDQLNLRYESHGQTVLLVKPKKPN